MHLVSTRQRAVVKRALIVVVVSFAIDNDMFAGTATEPSPATSRASTPQAFERTLREINDRSLRVKDLSAEFVQEKQSPLLRKPMVSRGTVAAKGDTSRWDTTAPESTQMTCDPHLLRLYYPDRHVVEE